MLPHNDVFSLAGYSCFFSARIHMAPALSLSVGLINQIKFVIVELTRRKEAKEKQVKTKIRLS
jgi:hypothetical protein